MRKKKYFSIGILVILSVFLTACFGEDKSSDSASPTTINTTVETNYLSISGDLTASDVSGSVSTVEKSVAKAAEDVANGVEVDGVKYYYVLALSSDGLVEEKAVINLDGTFEFETLVPGKTYIFSFLDKYGMELNEMVFSDDGNESDDDAATFDTDVDLGNLTIPVEGEKFVVTVTEITKPDGTNLDSEIEKQAKEEVTDYNGEEIVAKKIEAIKETLEEEELGEITEEGKIIITEEIAEGVNSEIEYELGEADETGELKVSAPQTYIVDENAGVKTPISLMDDSTDSDTDGEETFDPKDLAQLVAQLQATIEQLKENAASLESADDIANSAQETLNTNVETIKSEIEENLNITIVVVAQPKVEVISDPGAEYFEFKVETINNEDYLKKVSRINVDDTEGSKIVYILDVSDTETALSHSSFDFNENDIIENTENEGQALISALEGNSSDLILVKNTYANYKLTSKTVNEITAEDYDKETKVTVEVSYSDGTRVQKTESVNGEVQFTYIYVSDGKSYNKYEGSDTNAQAIRTVTFNRFGKKEREAAYYSNGTIKEIKTYKHDGVASEERYNEDGYITYWNNGDMIREYSDYSEENGVITRTVSVNGVSSGEESIYKTLLASEVNTYGGSVFYITEAEYDKLVINYNLNVDITEVDTVTADGLKLRYNDDLTSNLGLLEVTTDLSSGTIITTETSPVTITVTDLLAGLTVTTDSVIVISKSVQQEISANYEYETSNDNMLIDISIGFKHTTVDGSVVLKEFEEAKTYTIVERTTDEKVVYWNMLASDFNINISTIEEFYNAIETAKSKSNSEAMNSFFQAILNTEQVEAGLREKLLGKMGTGVLSNDYEVYDYADQLEYTSGDISGLVKEELITTLEIIADALEDAYKANETVVFSKEMTDGYNVRFTPAHFKAMSGIWKTYLSTVYLLSSYSFESQEDLDKFSNLMENFDELYVEENYPTIAEFLEAQFENISTLDVDEERQAIALKYAKEGMAEAVEAVSDLPIDDSDKTINSSNMLTITSKDQEEILEIFNYIRNALNGPTTVSVDSSETITIDLSALYSFNIKKFMLEVTTDVSGSNDMAEVEMKMNLYKSTLGGIFPNGLPEELKDELSGRVEYEERWTTNEDGHWYWFRIKIVREVDEDWKLLSAVVYNEKTGEIIEEYEYTYTGDYLTKIEVYKDGKATGEYKEYRPVSIQPDWDNLSKEVVHRNWYDYHNQNSIEAVYTTEFRENGNVESETVTSLETGELLEKNIYKDSDEDDWWEKILTNSRLGYESTNNNSGTSEKIKVWRVHSDPFRYYHSGDNRWDTQFEIMETYEYGTTNLIEKRETIYYSNGTKKQDTRYDSDGSIKEIIYYNEGEEAYYHNDWDYVYQYEHVSYGTYNSSGDEEKVWIVQSDYISFWNSEYDYQQNKALYVEYYYYDESATDNRGELFKIEEYIVEDNQVVKRIEKDANGDEVYIDYYTSSDDSNYHYDFKEDGYVHHYTDKFDEPHTEIKLSGETIIRYYKEHIFEHDEDLFIGEIVKDEYGNHASEWWKSYEDTGDYTDNNEHHDDDNYNDGYANVFDWLDLAVDFDNISSSEITIGASNLLQVDFYGSGTVTYPGEETLTLLSILFESGYDSFDDDDYQNDIYKILAKMEKDGETRYIILTIPRDGTHREDYFGENPLNTYDGWESESDIFEVKAGIDFNSPTIEKGYFDETGNYHHVTYPTV